MKIIFSTLFSIALLTPFHSNAQEDTLRIFVLAGQSNMVGWGLVYDVEIPGTLEHAVANNSGGIYDALLNSQNEFVTREDVWISMNNADQEITQGALTVNYGGYSGYMGPELGFGFTLGNCFDDDVLLIKTAWGGKNLAVDFRPPSAGGTTGEFYNLMIEGVNTTIGNIAVDFPQLADQPYKIEGFVWHQGWNDAAEQSYMDEYEQNLIHLIQDIRTDLERPNLPVVVANSGMGGFDIFPDLWTQDMQLQIAPAQQAATEYADFEGTVALADTRPFWQYAENSPSEAVHHWNDNAWTYLNIGQEAGVQMIELLGKNDPTNVQEPLDEKKVTLFPNPTTDQVNFSFNNSAVKDVQISLLQLDGRLVHQGQFSIENAQMTLSLNQLGATTSGVYLLEIRSEMGIPVIVRLVKE